MGYIWPNYTVGLQQAERDIELVLDHEEHGPLRGRKSGRIVNGPTVLWAFSRLKEKPGQKLAQYLNGSLKGRKMYILKIRRSIEWAINSPKSHRADIEPKFIAGC